MKYPSFHESLTTVATGSDLISSAQNGIDSSIPYTNPSPTMSQSSGNIQRTEKQAEQQKPEKISPQSGSGKSKGKTAYCLWI
jgi:hypothetical protein